MWRRGILRRFGIRELRQDRAVTVGPPMSTTLSELPARRVTHRTTDDGGRQFLSVWTVRSDGVWLVTTPPTPAPASMRR